MFKQLGNMGNILKLQKQFKDIQKNLQKKESSGTSSDGSVTATVNGEFILQKISIDEAILKIGDKKQIEKMIISAVNSAIEISRNEAAKEMSALTGGLKIPGFDMNDFLK